MRGQIVNATDKRSAATAESRDDARGSRSAGRRRLFAYARRFFIVCAIAYLGLIAVLALLERFLVYPIPPRAWGDWKPQAFEYEDVFFTSADGTRLHGWYFAHPDPRHYVLFCHGNGEDVSLVGPWAAEFRDEYEASVFVFDYRGYGRSEGLPFEQGVLDDGEAALQEFTKRTAIAPGDVLLYGRSLGGAVAVHLAARHGARGLILNRTFHSMVAIAADIYPWVPVRLLMRNRYESVDKIRRYHGPLLQMHGTADTIVPIESAERLFAAAPSSEKKLIRIEGLGHNDIDPHEFNTSLRVFLQRLATPKGNQP